MESAAMKEHPQAIPLEPRTLLDTQRSAEVARLWITEAGSYVYVAPKVLSDPKDFGRILADAMNQAAFKYVVECGGDPNGVLPRMFEGFAEAFPGTFVKLENLAKKDLN